MKSSWKTLRLDSLTILATFVVSSMIMLVSHFYSFGLFSIIIGPLIGGFMTAYLVLFCTEEGGLIYLSQKFWHTLLLGAAVALATVALFVCAISHHFLFFTAMSM